MNTYLLAADLKSGDFVLRCSKACGALCIGHQIILDLSTETTRVSGALSMVALSE